MACLEDLPVELLAEIVFILFYGHPDASLLSILCINALIKDLLLRVLYTHLRFRSIRQLSAFANDGLVAYHPKTVTVTLSGGTADFDVFRQLAGVFKRCGAVGGDCSLAESGKTKQVSLDLLSLCLHSHTRNPQLRYIFEALSLVK